MTQPALRKDHYCQQYDGPNSTCGDDAHDVEDGVWLCEEHAHFIRLINTASERQLARQ